MPTTFKAVVYADNKRQDGTYNIKIRVTHNRRTLKVSTNLYALPKDLTRTLKLKKREYIDQTDDMIRRWREIVAKLGPSADLMNVKEIVEHIDFIEKEGDQFKLDFIKYGHGIAATKSEGTRVNYVVALNAFCRFLKRDFIDISKITPKLLTEFEQFIETEPTMRGSKNKPSDTNKTKAGGRAVSLYLGCLRHIHNRAKEEFNDEERGIINIPFAPFNKYKVKKEPKPKRRAIPPKLIQDIINLGNETIRPGRKGEVVRRDLARDCVLLSLGLAGINAADLYDDNARLLKGKKQNIIHYNRKKTRTRRNDEAEMYIRIETCIMPLVEKYKDPGGERLFVFHKLYNSKADFNKALSKGLERIEKELNFDKHYTFYSFRHSWATIGRSNALNIDKYTIHEGLNHVDPKMNITDIYIERDYSNIWEANAKILGLFDWSALLKRELMK